jgi:hypothetical protein
MSTNIYFTPTDGPLVAFGRLHIGKFSGNQVSFQAYDEEGGKKQVSVNPQAGLSMEVDIPRLVIKSWADWKALLCSTPGEIESEYATPYSIAELEDEIVQLRPGLPGVRSHYDSLVAGEAQWGKIDPERNWKDAEGYSFSNYDFF